MVEMTAESFDYEKACRAGEALKMACEEVQDLAQCCPATQYKWNGCKGDKCEDEPADCWMNWFLGRV